MTRVPLTFSSFGASGPWWVRTALVALLGTTGGCEAVLGVGAAGGSDSLVADPDHPGQFLADAPEVAPLLRLTSDELRFTMTDLFEGDLETADLTADLPYDGRGPSGFVQGATFPTRPLSQFIAVAEKVAERALTQGVVGRCDKGEEPKACTETLIADFGGRAFRRPVTDQEKARLMNLFTEFVEEHGASHERARQAVVEAILASPRFLYHWELGEEAAKEQDGVIVLGDYEVASRLSYFLWQSLPDRELREAAAAGALTKPEELASQVRRMIHDPKAQRGLSSFALDWLHLRELEAVNLEEQMASQMRGEVEAYFVDLVMGEGGSGKALFMSDHAFVGSETAPLYGLASDSAQVEKVELPPGHRRAGLLTTPAFLTTHYAATLSHPIYRGKIVREQVLCQHVPAPPPGTDTNLPKLPDDPTVRETLAAHRDDPSCATCHELMDPLGFALASFDAFGRYQAEERPGLAWDTSAVISRLDDQQDPVVEGAREMGELFSEHPVVQRCVAEQVFRYALGRGPAEGDESSVERAYQAYLADEFDIEELLVQAATSFAFTHRAPSDGEVTQ